MGRPRIAEEQSATFVVNLPELGFEGHVKRIQRLLQTWGYRAMPMTHEYVLQMADDVRRQLADAEEAQRLLAHAAHNRPNQGDV
jgi:hypothetical protein